MDDRMEEMAKNGQKALLLLAELSQLAATVGEMANLYTERYLNKGEYRETLENWTSMGYEVF
jgi:hypothetical protein